MKIKRLPYQVLAITLILSLTLGCNLFTSLPGTSAPNPVTVEVKADETHAASAVISPDGGTITAQGADGTKYTLTFPKDALSNDETITLTPITAIDGLPFSGGFVGGVQMAPEGLRLLQPAIISIESPKTVAASGFETVAYAYHQNGEELYLSPSEAKGNLLTIEVWHFSGVGAAQGTPAEIQTQQQRVPSNAEDAFTQSMREYLGRERQAQLLGQDPDPEFERRIGEFLREAYDLFIAPQLPIALQDCEAAGPILSKALGWLRQVQLLGSDEQFQTESTKIMDTMSQAIVNCYNKEYDQCVIDKKIEHRTAMLGMFRQAALLGIDGQLDFSKIEKCPPPTAYKVDGPFGESRIFGEICSLDVPFTLNWDSGVGLAGTVTFTPTSNTGGTWSLEGAMASVGVTNSGEGSYSVQSSTENVPITLIMNGSGSQTTAGFGTTNFPVNNQVINLEPSQCSQP